jgi:hypothetical protein
MWYITTIAGDHATPAIKVQEQCRRLMNALAVTRLLNAVPHGAINSDKGETQV